MFLIRTHYLLIVIRRLVTVYIFFLPPPELAFQHIEQQFGCLLSPSIATPNIVSKGQLDCRTVNIPLSLYGLNEKPDLVTPAPGETPNWSFNIKDGERVLIVALFVPRLVRPPVPV